MKITLSKLLRPALVVAFTSSMFISAAQADHKIILHGASQFDEKHAFTRLMRKFEQLTKLNYSGEHEIEFVMHLNSELGLEKDYVANMNQGLAVDYAVVSPSHMSTFSKLATVLDPPMLYRDAGHWSKVLSSDVLQPVVDDIYKRADIKILGYGGGGVRHLIVNKPVSNMAEIKNVPIRVMGAPIQTKLFNALGMSPRYSVPSGALAKKVGRNQISLDARNSRPSFARRAVTPIPFGVRIIRWTKFPAASPTNALP